jgi:hypothetical protein
MKFSQDEEELFEGGSRNDTSIFFANLPKFYGYL